MFGFDFSELLVVFVVALIVLGPTRLPEVARKAGRWIGKARAMARDFQRQLESEVTLDELNRMTREQTRQNQNQSAQAPAASGTDTVAPAAPPADIASSGYPYGAPAEPSATPADPPPDTPRPGDDTYSHAHAADAAPPSWGPESGQAEAARAQPEPVPASGSALEPDPSAPATDSQRA